MTLKYLAALLMILAAALTGTMPCNASPATEEPRHFAGGDLLFSKRVGTYAFDDTKKEQDLAKKDLFLYGVSLGKRYHTPFSWLRVQAEGSFHFGSSIEDTLVDINMNPVQYFVSKYRFRHIGLAIDLHLLLAPHHHSRAVPYIALGGGIHYMSLSEQTVLPDDHSQEISLANYPGKYVKTWAPGGNLGAGVDVRLTKTTGISAAYAFTLWQPVKYLDGGDMPMPVNAIEYKETFYTNRFQVRVLVALGSE